MKFRDVLVGGIVLLKPRKGVEWARESLAVVGTSPPKTVIVRDYRGNNHFVNCGNVASVNAGVEIASIPTKNYREVIEVRVPVRFYWTQDCFDGIEFGPFQSALMPWQEDMTKRCLDAVGPAVETQSEDAEGGSGQKE